MNSPLKNSDEKFCQECGKIIKLKSEICPHCGCRQGNSSLILEKNKIIAALLALFFGGFGIHKFYLGRITAGILFLIFCWTFIPTIIAFIEGILLLIMSEEEFRHKYG